MGLSEVEDVDVISNAGAIGRFVIGAIDFDMVFLGERDLENIWDQVGLDAVVFAEFLRGTGGVEVAKGNERQAVNFFIPAEDRLKHELGLAVGIDRTLGEAFIERHAIGDAKGRAGGGEDEFFHAELDGHIEEVDARGDIVTKIFSGICHRLADEGVGGKVHNGFGFRLLEGVAEHRAVTEIALIEIRPSIESFAVALAEIIENSDFIAAVEKFFYADTSDVSGAASD
jgi:hypothetical protein